MPGKLSRYGCAMGSWDQELVQERLDLSWSETASGINDDQDVSVPSTGSPTLRTSMYTVQGYYSVLSPDDPYFPTLFCHRLGLPWLVIRFKSGADYAA